MAALRSRHTLIKLDPERPDINGTSWSRNFHGSRHASNHAGVQILIWGSDALSRTSDKGLPAPGAPAILISSGLFPLRMRWRDWRRSPIPRVGM